MGPKFNIALVFAGSILFPCALKITPSTLASLMKKAVFDSQIFRLNFTKRDMTIIKLSIISSLVVAPIRMSSM